MSHSGWHHEGDGKDLVSGISLIKQKCRIANPIEHPRTKQTIPTTIVDHAISSFIAESITASKHDRKKHTYTIPISNNQVSYGDLSQFLGSLSN